MTLTITGVEHRHEDFELDGESLHALWEMEERHFWHAARNRWIEAAMLDAGLGRGARILEVGCGSGAVAGYLHARGFEVAGVDTYEVLVRKAHERFPDVSFFAAGVADLPASVGEFDAVGFFDVLEHLDDPVGLVRTSLSRVKAGALVIATVPALKEMHTVVDDLSGHKRRYERGELAAQFKAAGIGDVIERGIFSWTLHAQKFSRRLLKARVDALTDAERTRLLRESLKVPPRGVNALLGVACAIERILGFGSSATRRGASLLVTGRRL